MKPELVIFIGVPASGKSTFYAARFFATHVRINLDMLRTRTREKIILDACLAAKQNLVIDNTNITKDDRASYIQLAKKAGFSVTGYYFQSVLKDCLARSEQRTGKQKIHPFGIIFKHKHLQLPTPDEGFEKLFYIEMAPEQSFLVKDWQAETPAE